MELVLVSGVTVFLCSRVFCDVIYLERRLKIVGYRLNSSDGINSVDLGFISLPSASRRFNYGWSGTVWKVSDLSQRRAQSFETA